jgi:hypothetical protein
MSRLHRAFITNSEQEGTEELSLKRTSFTHVSLFTKVPRVWIHALGIQPAQHTLAILLFFTAKVFCAPHVKLNDSVVEAFLPNVVLKPKSQPWVFFQLPLTLRLLLTYMLSAFLSVLDPSPSLRVSS